MTALSGQQEKIWLDRYVRRDESGNPIETTVDETFYRVAQAIGDNAPETEEFYSVLKDFHFVPGGRIISGAGAESEKTFYNCYVIPLETEARRFNRTLDANDWVELGAGREDKGSDSRESIFNTIETMVGIMSRGGGVGINWSVLRPEKAYLKRVSGTSSGPVGWMNVASSAVGEVEQGGTRRGAAMFMLDDWHPDVVRFINEKRDPRKITNANVSVAVSDAFMEAVSDDKPWTLRFPDTTHEDYNTVWDGDLAAWESDGRPVKTYATLPAREIWDALTQAAWASGEPGVVFLDRYNKLSTAAGVERIICVNPCGEQGLGPYSVCNLGSMNLYSYVNVAHHGDEAKDPNNFYGDTYFRWGDFRRDVGIAVRFLDNVISKSVYFLPETEAQQMLLRRIGLGCMGLADTLVMLQLRYGSPGAIAFVDKVYRTMKDAAIEMSSRLGYEKGPAKGWDDSMWERPFLREYLERRDTTDLHFRDDYSDPVPMAGMRNLFLLTQAPTGTTSIFADVNSGIEPYFNVEKTWREDRTGGRYVFPRGVNEYITGKWPYGAAAPWIVGAKDITVEQHIAMQAAAQKWIDSSISKTINAPSDATVEDVALAYTMAYDAGLKGLAYYRDGSRSIQVLYNSDPNARIAQLEEEVAQLNAKLNSPFRQSQLALSDGKPLDNKCPECEKGEIVHEEGCMKCPSCGWSAC